MFEKTLVLIKPDAVRAQLVKIILDRLLENGFELLAYHTYTPTTVVVEKHYQKKFQESPEIHSGVVAYLTSGPLVALALAREDAVLAARGLIGPLENAPAGTIRGDFKSDHLCSLVHASDSPEAAEYEIKVWFPADICESVSKFVRNHQQEERELLFAQAIAHQRNGYQEAAKRCAKECLALFPETADKSMDEAAATTYVIEVDGQKILLPEYLHTGTALRDFRAAGIEI